MWRYSSVKFSLLIKCLEIVCMYTLLNWLFFFSFKGVCRLGVNKLMEIGKTSSIRIRDE